jgi:hypothetical protein
MDEITIPEDALLHHLAILGKTGAGKTTAAKGWIERLLDEARRVCIVDPTGVWWGLRLDATGKENAFPVLILGGRHGDAPLGEHDGERVAEMVATWRTSFVLDTSRMRVGERTRFFTDFAEALMRENAHPLHLVIDEAHNFMPQGKVPNPQAGKMLHAANELLSGGRVRGLRVMLLSQRSAKIHKDSLTQVETLVAMRLIGPQDRAAVEAWIKDNGTKEEGVEIISSLPRLKVGEGWVWSPENDFLRRVSFPMIKTFDSSKAPDDGSVPVAPLHSPDLPLEELRSIMGAAAPAKSPAGPSGAELKAARTAGYDEGFEAGRRAGTAEGYQDGVKVGISMALRELRSPIDRLEGLAYGDDHEGPAAEPEPEPTNVVRMKPPVLHVRPDNPFGRGLTGKAAEMVIVDNPSQDDTGSAVPSRKQRDILAALLWVEAYLKKPDADRQLVAWIAGASAKASGFQNNLGAMRTAGLIDYPSPGFVMITDAGRAVAPLISKPVNRWELKDTVAGRLSGPQRAIFEHLWDAHPESFSRSAIALAVGKSEKASGFQNDLGRLRTLGLIDYPAPGYAVAADFLFN